MTCYPAYVRAPEPATLYRMHGSLGGAYKVPSIAARNRVVLTNRCPTGLNRGFGGPQLYYGLERTMAIAAGRLGLDPADVARRNLVPAESMPYRTPSGALYDLATASMAGGLTDAEQETLLSACGYDRTGDVEVDTGEQRSWTVQLTDTAEQAPSKPLAPRVPGPSRAPLTLPPAQGGKK